MNILNRIKDKIAREIFRTRLRLKAQFSKEGWIDYNWIKLPLSNISDDQELLYHIHCQEYYANDLKILQPYIKAGDTVIDIGANMGFVSALFSSLVGPGGEVYAF